MIPIENLWDMVESREQLLRRYGAPLFFQKYTNHLRNQCHIRSVNFAALVGQDTMYGHQQKCKLQVRDSKIQQVLKQISLFAFNRARRGRGSTY